MTLENQTIREILPYKIPEGDFKKDSVYQVGNIEINLSRLPEEIRKTLGYIIEDWMGISQ